MRTVFCILEGSSHHPHGFVVGAKRFVTTSKDAPIWILERIQIGQDLSQTDKLRQADQNLNFKLLKGFDQFNGFIEAFSLRSVNRA